MTVETQAPYDAIIIGGGPAGLTCAIFLGRYRRRVLVIDAGHPRNYATREIHGFLGQHGIPPGELLARGRAEAEASGVEIRKGKATKVERNGDLFDVMTEDGDGGVLRARRVVLAYGIRDVLPDIPEVESYYGITVHHCPDCDGYEARDVRIGVIGWGKSVVGLALKLLQWSDDIVVFTHGHEREWDEEMRSKLLAEQISVKDEKIVSLIGKDAHVEAAVLSTGERVPVRRIFFSIATERTCILAEEIGCACDPDKPNIVVDDHRRTSVEGVWAVGDLVAGSQLAITSAADGAIAAIDINKSL
ncbi:MAG TPA: NAD(P)/FAD-dependent oxidoreductase, partial [Thermoanaerobaculia bacterium]|nr:NAD(P)/FAD-dependent oxidoreductase [Thermoanaerobaculia bacterium]